MTDRAIDELCINTIRTLSIDAVERASSGHPGTPMGTAVMAYVLWTRHLRYHPRNPDWPDRDRFILSAGHASMLLYSVLFLTGYDLTLDDLRRFRQWESRTPGHPERGHTPGVEVTTGPLGQGFGNAVGMAMAERWLAATFNRPGHEVVDHCTYVLASDGDLMEGISSEAAALAGHLALGRLIVLYDSNRVTLSATTNLTFSEDVPGRFRSAGWHVAEVDGLDVAAVDGALAAARAVTDRPSLIVAHTHIGFGSPGKQDTFQAHGEPLGRDETRRTKDALGWPPDAEFLVPDPALAVFREAGARGAALEATWRQRLSAYREAHPVLADRFEQTLAGAVPQDADDGLPRFEPSDGPMATRDAGGTALRHFAARIPYLLGGSGDLDPSTKTMLEGLGDFQAPGRESAARAEGVQGAAGGGWGYAGRNWHFGVREHAMTAMLTGASLHGGVLPFGATFLTFSDYMRPSIRLAALSEATVIYVWTHDSIGLGEDGPTHQPVEHLASLRAVPNLIVIRPADATETVEAWRFAVRHRGGPIGLVLTRQKVPVLDRSRLAPADGLRRGAYVLVDPPSSDLDLILIATGSEVGLAVEAGQRLGADGVRARVVSMPSWELFEMQSAQYRDAVLPRTVTARIGIEAASPFGWERYVGPHGAILGVDRFGVSAPGDVVMRELGFTADHVVDVARKLLTPAAAMSSPGGRPLPAP